jgi:hypothetical protein
MDNYLSGEEYKERGIFKVEKNRGIRLSNIVVVKNEF